MSYYNILAIFNESQLVEVETVLNQLTLMNQGDKNSLINAVEDYQFLKAHQAKDKFTRKVVDFLLNPKSVTPEGIETFLTRLGFWLEVVESLKEQEAYANVLNNHLDIVYCFHDEEILALRFELLDVLRELEESKAAKKERKQHDIWERNYRLTQYEAPMQVQPGYEDYEKMMEEYGKLFDTEESPFNQVRNTKGMSNEQPCTYEAMSWVVPPNWIIPVLYQDN